jgi:hypothetical protein
MMFFRNHLSHRSPQTSMDPPVLAANLKTFRVSRDVTGHQFKGCEKRDPKGDPHVTGIRAFAFLPLNRKKGHPFLSGSAPGGR